MPHAELADPSREPLSDPTPLTPTQMKELLAAAGRELGWGLREVSRELRTWRALAELIPDRSIRDDALRALAHKRGHADGAALFSVLPDHRSYALLRLLVAYETILDFLDDVSERHATEANGRELHLALVDALDPTRPIADYYRHHPCHDDGGYLVTLVELCRQSCDSLPSYSRVRSLLLAEAWRAQVLALNHIPDPSVRDAALRRWAAREFPDARELAWFELSAASSASLVVHSLLALATEAEVTDAQIEETYAVYWPWTSLATAMLDSYVDQVEDLESGNHSYIAHYPDAELAIERVGAAIARAAKAAFRLPDGHRHVVIVSAMVAMYLSKDSARAPDMWPATRRLLHAGGSLARLLLPVLRAWRIVYSQRSS
jgi:tetraprenyl-beta-curcumene synthase